MSEEQTTFRAELRQRLPWWLRGAIGGRVAYAIGIVVDVIADMLTDAVSLRFPLAGQPDALSLLGADRRIPRGPREPASTYVVRLRRWLDDHRTRGGPYAMLTQMYAYCSALADYWATAPFALRLVYQLGNTFNVATDGSITRSTGSPVAGYDWPFWWLYVAWPQNLTGDGLWSDPGTWSDGGVWDCGIDAAQVADIRCVPTAWNAAHTTGMVVLVGPDTSTNQISINSSV